jgi:hypothetical protein
MRRYILLRCCTKWHRDKLESEPSCLEELVKRLGVEIPAQVVKKPLFSLKPSPSVSQITVKEEDEVIGSTAKASLFADKPRLRSSARLRTDGSSSSTTVQPVYDCFKRYENDPKDSVHSTLTTPLSAKDPRRGQVYCFTRASHPGYVKIGYTSRPVELRMDEWSDCNPDAELQMHVSVAFPERIERLIHLQMAKHRYKIVRCANCGKTHHEWFKVELEHARGVIEDWAEVASRGALYGADGLLSRVWETRVATMRTPITARMLLGTIKVEKLPQAPLVEDWDGRLAHLRDLFSTMALRNQSV